MAWDSAKALAELLSSGIGREAPGQASSRPWVWQQFKEQYGKVAREIPEGSSGPWKPFPSEPRTWSRWIDGATRVQAGFRGPVVAVFYGAIHVIEGRDSPLQAAWRSDDEIARPRRADGHGRPSAERGRLANDPGPLAHKGSPGPSAGYSQGSFAEAGTREAAPLRFVPFRPQELVGRDHDLDRIHQALQGGPAAIIPALSGMGGVGKTRLAVAYAYDERATAYEDGVFWIDAASPLLPQFADYGAQLPEASAVVVLDAGEHSRQLALRWVAYLRRHPKALVVLDNVEGRNFLTRRVPGLNTETLQGLQCSLLVTSRERQIDGCGALPLDVLPPDAAASLLIAECGWAHGERRGRRMAEICNRLGRLPLAIKLAGSLARMAGSAPAELLAVLRQRGVAEIFRSEGAPLLEDYAKTVDKVLDESWAAIPDDDEGAKALMWTLAALPESRIATSWLTRLLAPVDARRAGAFIDPVRRAAVLLSRFNLLEEPETGSFRLHPLIREHAAKIAPPGFGGLVASNLLERLSRPESIESASSADFNDLLAVLPVLRGSAEDTATGSGLSELERLVGLEADMLRRTLDPLPQLQRRAKLLGSERWASLFAAVRARLPQPWLRLSWTTERTDTALLRVAIAPDGPVAGLVGDRLGRAGLVCGQDGTVRAWDLPSCTPGRVVGKHASRIVAASMSWDGARALTASNPATLKLWDLEEEALLADLKEIGGTILACALSGDGRTAIAGTHEGVLTAWNADRGVALATVRAHQASVRSCALSRDGSMAVTGCSDGTIRVWRLPDLALLRSLHGHEDDVTACVLSSDGSFAVSGGNDATVRVWDLSDGTHRKMAEEHGFWIHACALDADDRTAATASEDNSVMVWDVRSGRRIATLRGHGDAARGVAWADGGRCLCSVSLDATLRLWDHLAATEPAADSVRHRDGIAALAFDPGGEKLLTGSHDNSLRFWEAGTGQFVRVAEGHSNWVCCCALGEGAAVAVSGSRDNYLRVWHGALSFAIGPHPARIAACWVSRDGRYAAYGGYDHTFRALDLGTRQPLGPELDVGRPVTGCAVSADLGLVLVATTSEELLAWRPLDGTPPARLLGHDSSLTCCALSADGTVGLSGSWDRTLRVWRDIPRQDGSVLLGHSGEVTSCALTSDGSIAVSGADDNSVRAWDVAAGREIAVAFVPNTCASISADGSLLAVGDGVGNVSMFELVMPARPRPTRTGHTAEAW